MISSEKIMIIKIELLLRNLKSEKDKIFKEILDKKPQIKFKLSFSLSKYKTTSLIKKIEISIPEKYKKCILF